MIFKRFAIILKVLITLDAVQFAIRTSSARVAVDFRVLGPMDIVIKSHFAALMVVFAFYLRFKTIHKADKGHVLFST